MKKIRILYTIPNFDTAGSGIALLKMCTRLDKNLFEPMIVCLHDRGAYFKEVKRSGIPVHIYPYLCDLKPRWRLLSNVIRIARFFRKLSPDIIFSYHYAPNFSEVIAAKLAGCKFAYVKKNMGWEGPSQNQWKIRTWFSDAITVQNTDMMKTFFPGNNKARLISIGVDQEEFHPRLPDPELRSELGIDSNDRIIVCVANLIPKKGIDFLIRGFAASSSFGQSRLIIVGNNKTMLWKETQALMDQLSVGQRVIFTGKQPDIPRFLSIADLFILASTGDEGAPIAIQEAMSIGVPVITTNTPGNRDQLDILPDQLIPPSDAHAISRALDHMLSLDQEKRDAIIAQQWDIIDKRYSLKEEVRQHEVLYKSLVNLEEL
jgi:glycosyltransferase involved in cell wall biosynthesis